MMRPQARNTWSQQELEEAGRSSPKAPAGSLAMLAADFRLPAPERRENTLYLCCGERLHVWSFVTASRGK